MDGEARAVVEDKAVDEGWLIQRKLGGDPSAHRPAREVDGLGGISTVGPPQAGGLDDVENGVFFHIDGTARPLRLLGAAVAQQVRRVDVKARGGEPGDQRCPILAARAQAVQQKKRLARRSIGRNSFEVVDATAPGIDNLAAHARAPKMIANLLIVDPQRIPVKRAASHKR
jgi:hypothetical protein